MDPVSMLVAALAAGASAGLSDAAKSAVKDAYVALRAAVQEKLRGSPTAEVVLAEHAKDPQTYEKPLTKQIDESGAAEDPRLIELAQVLMTLMEPGASTDGKYFVDLRGAQGTQVGDHNTQSNTFG